MKNKRWFFAFLILLFVIFLIPVAHLGSVVWREASYPPIVGEEGVMNDASRLNATHGVDVVVLDSDRAKSIGKIQGALSRAREEGRLVSVGGARHSMGGQTLNQDGIYIDMDGFSGMEMEKESGLLHVQSGARWRDIVRFLHVRDLSVSVMQTNNDFSVGGSMSVNAHGWQHNRAPVSSTVQAFDVLGADGKVVHCSREENIELFGLALGGYGLFGVILDVWLEVVPNERLRSVHRHMELDDFLSVWKELAEQEHTQMLYGRLGIDPDALFEEVLITGYVPFASEKPFPKLHEVSLDGLKRAVFRGSEESRFGKKLRWSLESLVGGEASGVHLRSVLQNEPASTYANRDPQKTDILHEYFVAPEQVVGFIKKAAKILQDCESDLLNVTIRSVDEDTDTLLRYAKEDMFAFVLLFTYNRDAEADAKMRECTIQLVDAVLAHEGSFYLPYRLHPTKAQFEQAYPQHKTFEEMKKKYDPDALFQNALYRYYWGKSSLLE
jgi:FAD/FMN-containing dehydrogenase